MTYQTIQVVPVSEIESLIESLKEQRIKGEFPEVMTISEVCKYLKFSAPHIRKLIKEQNLPCADKTGDLRFLKKKIDEWLEGK